MQRGLQAALLDDVLLVFLAREHDALFHAIFERDGIDYIERKSDDTPKLTPDGAEYLWDALRCARHYAKHYGDRYEKSILVALAKNLEFIFPIRYWRSQLMVLLTIVLVQYGPTIFPGK